IRERLFGGAIYFPLGFQLIDEQLVVTENLSDEPSIRRGDVIKSINQIPSEQLLDSLKTIAKVDGDNRSPISDYLSLDEFGVTRWEAFDLYFHLFFGVDETFQVQVAHGKETKNYTFPALTKKDRMDRYKGKPLGRWDLTFDDTKAIMKLGTFATWNWKDFDYNAWFQNAFSKIDSADSDHLIVDLRGNGGGLGEIRTALMSYLIKTPLECQEETNILVRATKVNEKFKPYIDTWVDWLFTGLTKDNYTPYDDQYFALEEGEQCITIQPKAKGFDGPVYFLGGPSNVSATFRLLEATKELEHTYFIGSETGGNQQGINGGEYLFFYLPYSGMEIDIPLKYFYGGPGRMNAGIQPDFTVKPSKEAVARNQDLHMELVDHLIAHQNKVTEKYVFSLLESENWTGKLSYLDYQSGNMISIPASLKAYRPQANTITVEYLYPEEPHMNAKESMHLDLMNHVIEGRRITHVENSDGLLTIIAEQKSEDNGKKIDLRFTYKISSDALSIQRAFKNEGETAYTIRNTYDFQR
ncbi:MAG: S41 family peptidase, partial [Bacteroidota bacterium]